jgi:hypothetical protein
MRVIGRSGTAYLIIQGDDRDAAMRERRPPARVYYADAGRLTRPTNLHSILGRGGWEPADMDDTTTRELLAGAVSIGGPDLDEPWELRRTAYEVAAERAAAERAAAEKVAA